MIEMKALGGLFIVTIGAVGLLGYSRPEGDYVSPTEAVPRGQAHGASPHFKRLEQTVGELVQEPLEVSTLTSIQTGAAAG